MRFEGPTGEPTHMMVATPEGAGPFPTVMYVHGGPEWADPDLYDPWTSTLVDHGVAVAKVNYRGSTGFGLPGVSPSTTETSGSPRSQTWLPEWAI